MVQCLIRIQEVAENLKLKSQIRTRCLHIIKSAIPAVSAARTRPPSLPLSVAQFQGPEDEEDFDDDRVEVLEDGGWMRGGAAGASGARTGGEDQEQSLGPLDRARLQQA